MGFDLAFINLVHAGREQRVEVFPAETEVGDAFVGSRNDAIHTACLVADLDAEACGHVKSAVAVHAEPVGGAVISVVGGVQPVVTLFGAQRAVRLNRGSGDESQESINAGYRMDRPPG